MGNTLYTVIMAGGSGTRFWPRSRRSTPKQLLALDGVRSLLQKTYDRVEGLAGHNHIIVITNAVQADETRRQLPNLPPENLIVEPVGRDTAPCIALTASLLERREPGCRMLVLPADHVITPADRFRDRILSLECHLEPGTIITLGADPTYPATAFGYIEKGEPVPAWEGLYKVASFREKPPLRLAEKYVEYEDYLWNCGIYLFTAKTILDEFKERTPYLFDVIQSIADDWGKDGKEALFEARYRSLKKISIDYAVIERAEKILVRAIDFEWNDLGSWNAVQDLQTPDEHGNSRNGTEHIAIDSRNCHIDGDGRLIATIGVKDLIIVQTKDATLICHKDKTQEVKAIVKQLEEQGRNELLD